MAGKHPASGAHSPRWLGWMRASQWLSHLGFLCRFEGGWGKAGEGNPWECCGSGDPGRAGVGAREPSRRCWGGSGRGPQLRARPRDTCCLCAAWAGSWRWLFLVCSDVCSSSGCLLPVLSASLKTGLLCFAEGRAPLRVRFLYCRVRQHYLLRQ